MSEVVISARAYTKMVFHAAKYPHCAVNGVLLSTRDATKSRNYEIVDAIPLFHICLHLSPMAEVALVQVEAAAAEEDLQICGYYSAAENYNDNSLERAPGAKLADKIAENIPNSCFAVIDNRAVCLNMERPAVRLWQSVEQRWTKATPRLAKGDVTLSAVSTLLQRGAMKDLVDFDNYLDNTENDWQNAHLNRDLNQILAMY
ncbi:ER membrane protein complex subunit 8/9 homolog [Phlebotomus argentipes]|uniref:ER membrane protein complex subunit 8/9 homolog n=1 Tax=Phlebotomus argentipes TaxID=94469 RepID=UPI002892E089|nr:ER membrane protein complex subunit 8/9 homolog [Phlebotomus argentipes]